MLARLGRAVSVYERRTGFAEAGAGIQLSPNASCVLLGLGLGPALARTAREPDGIDIRTIGGDLIAAVPLGPALRERHGAPYWTIARADLHTVLLDAVRADGRVSLRLGRSLEGLTQTADAVDLAFAAASGRETVRASLAIGADGIWSAARRLLGDPREPDFTGTVAYRATVAADALPAGLPPGRTGLWLGSGRHVVHYAVDGGRRINVVAVADERRPVAGRSNSGRSNSGGSNSGGSMAGGSMAGWSSEADPSRLARFAHRASPDLRTLLSGPTRWSAWALHDLPARRAGIGRAALVGDAAHPVLPYLAQGGALAIEDAWTLAGRVAEADGADERAVRLYGSRRLARVERVQIEARRAGFAYHLPGPAAALRNAVLRRAGEGRLASRFDWLYGWRGDA